MQPLLKDLLSELHRTYFKQVGFSKKAQRFWRDLNGATQEVEFQSSQWNSQAGPITFYVNFRVGFADIPANEGRSQLTGFARISGLVPGSPSQFDLSQDSYTVVRDSLLGTIPKALETLETHHEDVRCYALRGSHCVLPVPESWRTKI